MVDNLKNLRTIKFILT